MAFPFDVTITVAAADADGIATGQTLGGAGVLTLDGALVTGGVATLGADPVQRRVSLTSVGNLSAVNFTVTGTDGFGNTVEQTISGPNNTTVSTTLYFRTVVQVSADAAVATAVSAGTDTQAATPWLIPHPEAMPFAIGLGLVPSGVTFTVEHTWSDVETGQIPDTFPHEQLVAQNAAADGNYAFPIRAFRAFTTVGAGSLRFYARQATVKQFQ